MIRAIALSLACLLWALGAQAHPLAPSLLDLRAREDGRVDAVFKTPALQPSGSRIEPVLPAHCRVQGEPQLREEGSAVVLRTQLDCGERGLIGSRVGFTGLDDSRTNALVRVELAGGHLERRVLDASSPTLEIRAAPGIWATAREYFGLGFEHILGGIDHLLFVLGLLLLVSSPRMLVETVTAFTLGHSITLSLAALGFVRAPTGAIEVAIAGSIVWLAVEIAEPAEGSLRFWQRPRTLAGGFGLLHGFGFAGALAEVGLPAGDIPLALGAFNLGIEAGQLCFVAGLVLAYLAASRQGWSVPVWGARAVAYGIGSLAAFWMFERAAGLF